MEQAEDNLEVSASITSDPARQEPPGTAVGPLGHPSPPDRWTVVLLGGVLAAATVLFLSGLGRPELGSPHEARVIATGQTMAETGEYVVPSFNGSVRLQKPPLPYWVTALVCHLARPGQAPLEETWARLPSALLGLAGLALTALLARVLFDRPTAWLSAVLLATTLKYVTESRLARVDIHLCFWVIVTLALLGLIFFGPKRRDALWLGVGLSLGMAFLAKWVNAWLFVCGPLVAGWIGVPQRRPRWRWVVAAVLLFAVVGLGWELLLIKQLGWQAVVDGWQREISDNVTSPVHRANHGVFYYVPQVFLLSFPWCAALPIGLTLPFWRQFKGRRLRLLWITSSFLVALLVLCFISKKKMVYLLPGLPALAILGARSWLMALEDLERQVDRTYRRCPLGWVQAVLFVLTAVVAVAYGLIWRPPGTWALLIGGVGLLGTTLLGTWWFLRGRGWWALVSLIAGMMLFAHALIGGFWSQQTRTSSAHLAEKLGELSAGRPLAFYRWRDDTLFYYLRTPIDSLPDANALVQFAETQPHGIVLVRADHLQEAQTAAPDILLHDPSYRDVSIPLPGRHDDAIDLYALSVSAYDGPVYEPSPDGSGWVTAPSPKTVSVAERALDRFERLLSEQPDGFVLVHDRRLYRLTPLDANIDLLDGRLDDRIEPLSDDANGPTLGILSLADYRQVSFAWGQILWLGFGFLAQSMFFGRFLLQWLASEKQKASVVPVGFWWLSLAGGLMLLIYAVHRRDPVFIVGQATGVFIYVRNLTFIYAGSRRRSAQTSAAKEGPQQA